MTPDRKRKSEGKKIEKAPRNLPAKKLTTERADKVRGGRRLADELPKES